LSHSAERCIIKAQLTRAGEDDLHKEIHLLRNKGKADTRQLKQEKNNGFLVICRSVLAKKPEEQDEAEEKKAQKLIQKRRRSKNEEEKIQGPFLFPAS